MPVVMPKGKKCAFIYDLHVDGPCLWFGGGFSSNPLPTSVSRGEFALREGLPRMLALLRKLDLKCTFAVPGHDAESFPDRCRKIVEDGHEVIRRELVCVAPAHYEDVTREIVIRPGCWETVEERVAVSDGRFEDRAEQELVSAGHWE